MLKTKIDCFNTNKDSLPIYVCTKAELDNHLDSASEHDRTWLLANDFQANPGQVCLIPSKDGKISSVYFGAGNDDNIYNYADIFYKLPPHTYHYENPNDYCQLMWGLSAYGNTNSKAQLRVENLESESISTLESIYWVRDLINAPANHLGPDELAEEAFLLSKFGAKVNKIAGKDLEENFPAIYVVGKASERKPCLIDIQWGESDNPTLALVGKGVCFDSGGLNIKPTQGMRNMKKDMGGAANVLALARMLMKAKTPINLRVLIPIVENSVSGNAYRPGDIIETKSGLTVEIDNTDAEGRVILSDALYEASSKKTDLLINMATLTGIASYGLAPDLPSMFCSNEYLARELVDISYKIHDPVWHMPYHQNYESSIVPTRADLANATSNEPYGGAIKAALFLQKFVQKNVSDFIHFDMMAWNVANRPGRPIGGEAMAIRTLFNYVNKWVKNN